MKPPGIQIKKPSEAFEWFQLLNRRHYDLILNYYMVDKSPAITLENLALITFEGACHLGGYKWDHIQLLLKKQGLTCDPKDRYEAIEVLKAIGA